MKFQIKHEIKGRLRIHMKQSRMTFEQADILHYAIQKMDGVSSVKVYERTGDAVICFHCSREELIDALSAFDYDRVNGSFAEFRQTAQCRISGKTGGSDP